MQIAFEEELGIKDYNHGRHHKRFRNWIGANANHACLAQFDGGVPGIWDPLFINGQAVVLCINVPVTTSFDTTTPVQVIQEFEDICARSEWLHWWGAAVDIMVSDLDGNAEDHLIKKTVIYIMFPSTAMT